MQQRDAGRRARADLVDARARAHDVGLLRVRQVLVRRAEIGLRIGALASASRDPALVDLAHEVGAGRFRDAQRAGVVDRDRVELPELRSTGGDLRGSDPARCGMRKARECADVGADAVGIAT